MAETNGIDTATITAASTNNTGIAGPDAAVVALCHQITAGHGAATALAGPDGCDWERHAGLIAVMAAAGKDMIARLVALPATTLAGIQGKATVLTLLCGEHDALASSLARDVLALA